MAGDLIQQKKNQQTLIIVLVVVLVITFIVVYQGFSKKGGEIQEEPEEIFVEKQEIRINFDILASPVLDFFQPFYEIEPFVESTTTEEAISVGRENPFLPY